MASKPAEKATSNPRNDAVSFDVVFETVVGVVTEGDGALGPVDAAMLLISQQFTKEAEEANGIYRFVIPNHGRFEILFNCDPFYDDRIAANRSKETVPMDTSRFMDDLSDFSRKA